MDFDKYQNKLDYPGWRAGKDTLWFKEEQRLHEQFKEDLLEELGVTDNPKADLLFAKAWESGHSGGYYEVYNVALDLVDLIV